MQQSGSVTVLFLHRPDCHCNEPVVTLPPNLCTASRELSQKLAEIILKGTPKVEEVNPADEVNSAPAVDLSALSSISKEGQELFQQLYASHMALKKIDQEMHINDLEDVEKGCSLQTEYVKISSMIAALIRQGEQSEEIPKATGMLDAKFAEHFLPATDSPRFKMIQARQSFLDSLEKGFLHLEKKGMRAVWQVDSSETVRRLNNARNVIHTILQKTPGAPTKSLDYHDAQIADYKHQFTYRFIETAFDEIYNAGLENFRPQALKRIHFAAMECIKAFADIRNRIDEIGPLKDNRSIESMDVLHDLIKFAESFGKLKRLDLELRNKNLTAYKE